MTASCAKAARQDLVAEKIRRASTLHSIVLKNLALRQMILSLYFRLVVCAPADAGFLFVIGNLVHSFVRFRVLTSDYAR